MTLDEIHDQWEADSLIDRDNLHVASSQIGTLQSKYARLLSNERLSLRLLETEYKQLRLEKYVFLTQGPYKDDPRGWKLPASGQILVKDVPMYLDADKELSDLWLKMKYSEEKTNILIGILDSIRNRSFHVNGTLEAMKFYEGN
jgi:Recombination, repair and ssDNA binding protein UvsY